MHKSLLFYLLFLPAMLCAQESTWKVKAKFTGLPGNHIMPFAIGDYGYALSSWFFDQNINKRLYRYDPLTNTWAPRSNFPGPHRGYAVSLSYKGKGYIGFGAGANDNLNDLWEYDPDANTWKELPNCPCDGRLHPAFVALDDKIYVGMGGNQNGDLDDWWVYDLPTQSWSQKAKLPAPKRHHPYYFALGQYAYVGFGHSGANIYADFYQYDPSTDTWKRKPDIPGSGRVAGTQFDHNGKGYVVSGQDTTHRYNLTEFWEYNPASEKWAQLPDVFEGRWAPGAFVVGNTAYILGGDDENGVKKGDLWAYTFPETTSTPNLFSGEKLQVYPNPSPEGHFNLDISLPTSGALQLELRNAEGKIRAVRTYDLPQGRHLLPFQENALEPGLYYLRLKTANRLQMAKIVVNGQR